MSKDSIEIKWAAVDPANYEATIAALQAYETSPTLTASIRLKGRITPDGVKQILQVVANHGAEASVSLKAEWPAEEDGAQLRLFPPNYAEATVADIEGWLNRS